MHGMSKTIRWLLAVVLTSSLSNGCAPIRLPAIDPTGQSLFLPQPASTTLEPCGTCELGFPQPAYVDPPAVPLCPAPVYAAPAYPVAAGPVAQPLPAPVVPVQDNGPVRLMVTPGRLIAPVGSEVVLQAGLVGGDGRYAVNQKMEWTVTQDSVGHLVEVGGEERECFSFLHGGPKKRSADYAVTKSTRQARIITRGTPARTDDVMLPAGRSWVSVTSPTEGTTHVTVVAPEAAGWDQRRQAAAIHWIDAKWQLPDTAIRPAGRGQKYVLTTKVMRASNDSALEDWIVRYEIISGDPSAGGQIQRAVEKIRTNKDGLASVEISPNNDLPGITQVHIEIIRPSLKSGDLPELVVGQGWTSVTWSAPGLALRATGPAQAVVESPLTYRIEVTNPGDLPSENVRVHAVIPQGFNYISSSLQPDTTTGNRLNWIIPNLPPKGLQVIEVNVKAVRANSYRFTVNAETSQLKADDEVLTNIMQPALVVRVFGDETARVGDRVTYRLEITNTGNERLSGVQLIAEFDRGLREKNGFSSPLRRSVTSNGILEPGQSIENIAITYDIVEAGRQCQRIQVRADGGHFATAESCVAVAAAPAPIPKMEVQFSGPDQASVGETVDYLVQIVNTGTADLTNIEALYDYPDSVQALEATVPFNSGPNRISWRIASLAPGQTQERLLKCKCLAPTDASQHRITVTTAEQLTKTAQISTRIVPAAVSPNPLNPPGNGNASNDRPAAPASGNLVLTLAETSNPVQVGKPNTYFLTIKNDRNVSDRQVALTVRFPANMKVVDIDTGVLPIRPQDMAGENQIKFTPIAEIRAGETLPAIKVVLSAAQVGTYLIQAEVTSRTTQVPVKQEKQTTVVQ